jgi:hypothetical protein
MKHVMMVAAVLVLGSVTVARADYWQDREMQQRLDEQERQMNEIKERQKMLQIEQDFNAMQAQRALWQQQYEAIRPR